MKIKDVERMERHQKFQDKCLPKAEASVESIQEKLDNKEYVEVLMTKHGKDRELFRAISNRDIMEVIENGFAIECYAQNGQSVDLLMMGYVKISAGYRPLHLALNITDNVIVVKTAYDPRSKEEQWENNYQTRVFYTDKQEAVTC